jgi:ketosteroid isomerase-like protein
MNTDETQILALLRAQAAGVRDKNVDAALAPYGRAVVKYDLAPPLRTTGSDPRQLAAWFANFEGPITKELHDVTTFVSGDIAFSHGLVRLGATTREGEAWAMWMRATWGLQRREGAWTIIHEHGSVPFRMDGSFLAATDLEP